MTKSPKICLLLFLATPLAAQTDWTSYFGGAGDDWVLAMQTDARGRIYVCGQCDSPTHVSANAYQRDHKGGNDAFIACLDPRQPRSKQLVWATHLGGKGNDSAYDLHVDAAGTRVTVTGHTTSTDFPIRNGWQSKHGGGRDAFVAVFEPARSGAAQLLWSTFHGGTQDDVGTSIDARGGLPTVLGTTRSTDLTVTPGALQPKNAGGQDLFVCRLTGTGAPVFSTYLGGSGDECTALGTAPFQERLAQIAVDDLGRITLASFTSSTDFPNPFKNTHGTRGMKDMVVSRLDAAGSRLLYSAVLGGSTNDEACELTLDGRDRIVIAGHSNGSGFPTTPNRVQQHSGARDAVIVHLDLANDRILYATYLGGAGTEYGNAAYREPSGTFVLGGHSWGITTTPGAPKPNRQATGAQAILARLRPGPTSTTVQYLTYFGGSEQQTILALAADGEGGVVAAGPTISPDFPCTQNGFDRAFVGPREGWITVHRMLPAMVNRLGPATTPCGPTPYLQLASAPLPSNASFAIEMHDAPPRSAGVLVLGIPMPAGIRLLDVDLFLAPPLALLPVPTTDAQGFSSLAAALPATFQWNGSFGLQGLWLTPGSCSKGVLSSSNALR